VKRKQQLPKPLLELLPDDGVPELVVVFRDGRVVIRINDAFRRVALETKTATLEHAS
jgi:hypothetical protein